MATPPFPTPPPPITLVRWPEKMAARLLHAFVFGGPYAGTRPPRGIDPAFVSWWIVEKVPLDAAPIVVEHVAEVLRFYERNDVLHHISRMLTRAETNERELRRSMYALQCIGEVGTPEQVRLAATYFHEYIVPHPVSIIFFPLLLETAEALAGSVDMGALGRRLQREIAAVSQPGVENAETLLLKYDDWSRNGLAVAMQIVETKQRLLNTDPQVRMQELLVIYLGESPVSTPSMTIWAGRLLRKQAQVPDGGVASVIDLFTRVMDATLRSTMPKPKKNYIFHRAAQAVIYFMGKLSFAHEEFYDSLENGPENFLWDDPGMPGVTP